MCGTMARMAPIVRKTADVCVRFVTCLVFATLVGGIISPVLATVDPCAGPSDGMPCDRDACTVGGYCQQGACVGAHSIGCPHDSDACTVDRCDATSGCVHEAVAGTCG